MENNYCIIYNPISGNKSGESCAKELQKRLGARECIDMTSIESYADFFAEHEDASVIICGGDGTLNRFLNDISDVDIKSSIYFYPCGSGNDYVKYYGGAARFLDIDALIAAEEKVVDAMRVGDRYSINVTNFGFDTTVAKTMHEVRRKKIIGGKNAYTTGIVKALITSMKNDCTVWVDGEKLNDGKMLLCTVSNGRYVGGAYCCAPHSRNDDGLLDVCLVKPLSRLTLVKLIGVYKKGKHLDDPRFKNLITYRRGKSVRVVAPEGFGYTLDGEIVLANDFTIDICPGAVRFAVPKCACEAESEQPEAVTV